MSDQILADRRQRRVECVSQAVVELPVKDAAADFIEVQRIVLCWLENKAGQLLPEAMRRGETGTFDLIGAQRTETVALQEPRYWAARQDDQDKSLPRRSWINEAMLAQSADCKLLLGFRLNCVALGDAAPFTRSVPRFMRDIAQNRRVQLDGVDADLYATPVEMESDVDALVQLLADPRRGVPVVGVSMDCDDLESGSPLIDADRLANEAFGTAHIRIIARKAAFMLTDRIGKRLSVYQGAVRIWRDVVRPGHDDPYDHPLILSAHILEDGADRTRRNLVDRILRTSAGRRDAEQSIPAFAEARRAAAVLFRERAVREHRSTEEMLSLYELENQRLTDERKETEAKCNEYIALGDEECAALRAGRDDARQEIWNLNQRLDAMDAALRAHDRKPDVPTPDNFSELQTGRRSTCRIRWSCCRARSRRRGNRNLRVQPSRIKRCCSCTTSTSQ